MWGKPNVLGDVEVVPGRYVAFYLPGMDGARFQSKCCAQKTRGALPPPPPLN